MNDAPHEPMEMATKLFAVRSPSILVRIINALFQGEKNAGQLLDNIDTAQPNRLQHLIIMCRAGIVRKRRQVAQMCDRIADESAVGVCRAVCTQVAIDSVVFGGELTTQKEEFV